MPETNEPKAKLCPFTKEDCVKDGCALWTNVVINGQKKDMCAFCSIIMAIVMSKPQPVTLPGGMPPGGLGPHIFKG